MQESRFQGYIAASAWFHWENLSDQLKLLKTTLCFRVFSGTYAFRRKPNVALAPGERVRACIMYL
mgnify:CR=1 FL=1